jgi:hypothetical protein
MLTKRELGRMSARKGTIGRRTRALPVLAAALVAVLTAPARAEVTISGRADALVVEARGAPVADVLAALGASFDFKYRTTVALSRVVSGRYAGRLSYVVARLLDGYDYVAQSSPTGVSVVIFAPGLANRTPVVRTSVAAATIDRELIRVPGQPEGWDGRTSALPVAAPKKPVATVPVPVVGAMNEGATNEAQGVAASGQPEGWSGVGPSRTTPKAAAPVAPPVPPAVASVATEEPSTGIPGQPEGWDGGTSSRTATPPRIAPIAPPAVMAEERSSSARPGEPEGWDGRVQNN